MTHSCHLSSRIGTGCKLEESWGCDWECWPQGFSHFSSISLRPGFDAPTSSLFKNRHRLRTAGIMGMWLGVSATGILSFLFNLIEAWFRRTCIISLKRIGTGSKLQESWGCGWECWPQRFSHFSSISLRPGFDPLVSALFKDRHRLQTAGIMGM